MTSICPSRTVNIISEISQPILVKGGNRKGYNPHNVLHCMKLTVNGKTKLSKICLLPSGMLPLLRVSSLGYSLVESHLGFQRCSLYRGYRYGQILVTIKTTLD